MIHSVVVSIERDGKKAGDIIVSPRRGLSFAGIENLYPIEVKIVTEILATMTKFKDHALKEPIPPEPT